MKRLALAAACVALGCASARTIVLESNVADARRARAIAMPVGDATDEDELRGAPPGGLEGKKPPPREPKESVLPNGVRVVTVTRRDFPTIACAFVLDRGAAATAPGAAQLYAHALLGASQRYDDHEQSEYLRYVGASVTTAAYEDGVVLTVSALTPLFHSALSRAAPMFVEPKLAGKDLDLSRTWAIARRSTGADDPRRRASEALFATLFPAHPYGAPVHGGPNTIETVSRDAIEQLRDRHLSARHVVVACAGDLEHAAIEKLVDRYTSTLKAKPEAPVPSLEAPALGAQKVLVVDRPGAAQSAVALGFQSPPAGHPDVVALGVLAALSTTGLSSRLNLTVREELGATYGVRMHVTAFRHAGAVTIQSSIDTPETVPALRRLLEELAKLRTEVATPLEIETAKIRASFEDDDDATASELATGLAHRVLQGRPPSPKADTERLHAIGAEDIRAAAARHLDPAKARLVIVGDAARIAKDLGALGLGSVDVVR